MEVDKGDFEITKISQKTKMEDDNKKLQNPKKVRGRGVATMKTVVINKGLASTRAKHRVSVFHMS